MVAATPPSSPHQRKKLGGLPLFPICGSILPLRVRHCGLPQLLHAGQPKSPLFLTTRSLFFSPPRLSPARPGGWSPSPACSTAPQILGHAHVAGRRERRSAAHRATDARAHRRTRPPRRHGSWEAAPLTGSRSTGSPAMKNVAALRNSATTTGVATRKGAGRAGGAVGRSDAGE